MQDQAGSASGSGDLDTGPPSDRADGEGGSSAARLPSLNASSKYNFVKGLRRRIAFLLSQAEFPPSLCPSDSFQFFFSPSTGQGLARGERRPLLGPELFFSPLLYVEVNPLNIPFFHDGISTGPHCVSIVNLISFSSIKQTEPLNLRDLPARIVNVAEKFSIFCGLRGELFGWASYS